VLHVNVIAVGRLKERFWADACAEYLKRLSRYAKVRVSEVPASAASAAGASEARARETRALAHRLAALAPALDARTVLLDRKGAQLTSEEFAFLIAGFARDGASTLNLVIGGSTGVDAALLLAVDKVVSFGRVTLPHNLARVVCLEQLYRACRINAGEPYHK
jgi:23S rRNA (pseudouridine1915-N3)-methyltransferase